LLHFLEAVVIVLEDLLRVVDVELVLGVLVPRQADEPVDVMRTTVASADIATSS